MNDKNVALQVAHQQASGEEDGIVLLSTGYRARINPVAASLITDATSLIVDPPVPIVFMKEVERDGPNPFDPEYVRTIAKNDQLRGVAAMDVMVYFGVTLVDGLPIDGTWLTKIRFMGKLGRLDLSIYDLEDPIDQEFLFLRYIAVAQADLELVSKRSGISPEVVEKAKDQFQGS